MNHYETVFILNPVLSDEQTKETVLKYEKFLTSKGAKFVSKEDWGLKKLAYPCLLYTSPSPRDRG